MLITIKDLLKRVRTATFDLAESSRQGVAEKVGTVTCTPKCSYCCYPKIVAPSQIGVIIYLYLKTENMWTPALRQKLVDADRNMTAKTHRDWLESKMPCVFLKEESYGCGSCSIYPVRPECCAVTYSVVPDPRMCGKPDGEHLVSAIDEKKIWPFIALWESIKPFSDPLLLTTFPGSVLMAEAHIEGLPEPEIASLPEWAMSVQGETVEEMFDKFVTKAST